MRAVEQSVSVHYIVPVVLTNVVRVVISVVLDVELVALDVLPLDLAGGWQCLPSCPLYLEPKCSIIAFDWWLSGLLLACGLCPSFIVEGCLQTAQFVIEIYKDIGARNLY